MRKILLIFLCVDVCFSVIAQENKPRENFPAGFQRGLIPADVNKYSNLPALNITEETIGYTFYDNQTNGSISNRVVKNANGTVSAAWNFSPNSTANWPQRGTGYDYFNGTNWIYSATLANIPATRIEPLNRTGSTNIAVTSSGEEVVIAHSSTLNHVDLITRPVAGSGAWTEHTTSLGVGANNDTWCKAVASGDTIYSICLGAATPGNPIHGQEGPILFSCSHDGGLTWPVLDALIPPLDSSHYLGFGSDSYSIDARGNTVVIAFGGMFTDLGIVKSTDAGVTWTKTVIHAFPVPFYASPGWTYFTGGAYADTVDVGVDANVVIDNVGMCHVFWGSLRWSADSILGAGIYYYSSDALYYWNESMAPEAYRKIASVWTCNGGCPLILPTLPDTTCPPLATYHGGLTQMPSAGIDHNNGDIYVTYQSVCTYCDASMGLHKHVYIIKSTDDGNTWTLPEDIVPLSAVGGSGAGQEAVFACIARTVDNDAWVVYQRDLAPGTSLSTNSCEAANNSSAADIIAARISAPSVGLNNIQSNNVFVSQNYPNPARTVTNINVGLRMKSDIRIIITDLLGKIVHSEFRKDAESGTHTITLNITGLEPGIYFYSVETGDSRVTKKMIVN